MITALVVVLGGADAAIAKKVKTTATVITSQETAYSGGVLTADWQARSKNGRCLRAITGGHLKFWFIANDEYYPPGPSDAFTYYAGTNYLRAEKVDEAHFRFKVPGSSTVATHFRSPGFPYAGTYSFERWARGKFGPYPYPYGATGPWWLIAVKGGYSLKKQYKLKYGKKPFRHVIVCEVEAFDDDPGDEEWL